MLELIGEGLTNRQIGERMFLAEKTVKNYVSSLLAKLGLERRTQAAVFASKHPLGRARMDNVRALVPAVVEAATRAPSVHNTQPWRFVAHDDVIELWDDPARGLPVLDPVGRARHISCGAALALAEVAAAGLGVTTRTTLLPDAAAPDHLADLQLGAPRAAGRAAQLRAGGRDRSPAHRARRLRGLGRPAARDGARPGRGGAGRGLLAAGRRLGRRRGGGDGAARPRRRRAVGTTPPTATSCGSWTGRDAGQPGRHPGLRRPAARHRPSAGRATGCATSTPSREDQARSGPASRRGPSTRWSSSSAPRTTTPRPGWPPGQALGACCSPRPSAGWRPRR